MKVPFCWIGLLCVSGVACAQPPEPPFEPPIGATWQRVETTRPRASGQVAPGWPRLLTGNLSGSPVAANLDGQGALEIVAATMYRRTMGVPIANPKPQDGAFLWAFQAGGKDADGWPVMLQNADTRRAARGLNMGDVWFCSPTVADFDGDELDEIITPMPRGSTGLRAFYGDGTPWAWPFDPKQIVDLWTSVPAADVDGDGVLDFVSGRLLTNALGKSLKSWPDARRFMGGFQSCLGDADGDGKIEVFHSPFGRSPDGPGQKAGFLGGFDNRGLPLPGWPVSMDSFSIYPVMGDVAGDGKKEISAPLNGRLKIWNLDGSPLSLPSPQSDGLGALTQLSLADCDGDGQAEILWWDEERHALCAVKGNGQPVTGDSDVVVSIPERASGLTNGVSVADLGSDGEMDIFVGSFWIKWKPGQVARVESLLDENPTISATPTICDLESDGQAEVLLGSDDGRVWVYQTQQKVKSAWVQWATTAGNARHTSCWEAPTKTR